MNDHTVSDAPILRDWRKSSYSGAEAGSCLEVLDDHPTGVPVRDSKTPHAPSLLFPRAGWSSFVAAIKDAAPL
ncbi:DUF397 domain-containing protein [Streptomyces sp. NPDC101062]|uniref:DUF397 domain-containing protein n=1 Tax=unclassified Streptomyces TaxID=2593676 RepID=UPI0037F99C66